MILLRSIIKGFQNPEAQPYMLPQTSPHEDEMVSLSPALAAELEALEEAVVEPDPEQWEETQFPEAPAMPEPPPVPEPPKEPEVSPVEFAKIQADAIIAEARTVANEILADVEVQAADELELLRSGARDEGYRAGYARGMMDAVEQSKEEQEVFQQEVGDEVKQFIEAASQSRERMIDETTEELRDLAIAVAEKVVRVSLKTSSEVIVRMIQSATDRMKRREWVHIYISGCDGKSMAEISPALSTALSALSDHIRIIPMQDDEIGTCIIETPEEIIDASLSTQISNIRNLVSDQSPSHDVTAF